MTEPLTDWLARLWNFDEPVVLKDLPHAGVDLHVPATPLVNLGDPAFCRDFNLSYPYMAGAMANGIASEEIVEALANKGMLGIFGAAGLSLARIEKAILRLKQHLPHRRFGVNLIHTPNEPKWEWDVVRLLLKYQVNLIEASAYMKITEPLVWYRLKGLRKDSNQKIVEPNQIIAKASRVELAEKFFAPPPLEIVNRLFEKGLITEEERVLSQTIPLAQYVTAESDSGGHTDNRPLLVLLPLFLALKNHFQQYHKYPCRLMVGAAGGIGTPQAVAAAFAAGAAYVVTGSINQSCQEAWTSETVRRMLASAQQADVAMAPAADMFEMGIKVQVLKRGTMFPMRAQKLFDLYRAYASLEDLPAEIRLQLEQQIFRESIAQVWEQTREFFAERDPELIRKSEHNPRLKMALVFRSYLGRSSGWANYGEPTRQLDYQIWCGPVIGAFNQWCQGSFMESSENRRVANVALNLLSGAAFLMRLNFLRAQGLILPDDEVDLCLRPKTDAELIQIVGCRL